MFHSMTEVTLRLISGVVLLLWASGFCRTGMLRGFGTDLRTFLTKASQSRVTAVIGGISVTTLLQSSLATCLMLSTFAGAGGISLAIGLAVMLGADVGSALVVQFLSLDLQVFRYLLLSLGGILFVFNAEGKIRNVARILLGLGMIMESLAWISLAGATIRESELSGLVISTLAREPFLAVLVGMAFGWVLHSSLVTVLFLVSLTGAGIFSGTEGFSLMLGANVGAAIPAVVSLWGHSIGARRIAVGNLMMKAVTALVLIIFGESIAAPLLSDLTAPFVILYGHLAFNTLLLVVFIPLTDVVAKIVTRVFKETVSEATNAGTPRYLSENDLGDCALALSNASREVLRMGDLVLDSVDQIRYGILNNELIVQNRIGQNEQHLDHLFHEIRDYLVKLSCTSLSASEKQEVARVLDFAVNLEHAGDIIVLNLTRLMERKAQRNLSFSSIGESEITSFFSACTESMRRAMNAFYAKSPELAERLIYDKRSFREDAHEVNEHHFERLRSGNPHSIESSTIHLDLFRDLKRVHAHFVTVAYALVDSPERRPAKPSSGMTGGTATGPKNEENRSGNEPDLSSDSVSGKAG